MVAVGCSGESIQSTDDFITVDVTKRIEPTWHHKALPLSVRALSNDKFKYKFKYDLLVTH